MISKTSKNSLRLKRHLRLAVKGTAERPRLSVFRSNKAIYCQLINDDLGVTLASASSRELGLTASNVESAKQVGSLIAKKAKEQNITKVVFDRSGYLYHGKIKALADAARAEGLDF